LVNGQLLGRLDAAAIDEIAHDIARDGAKEMAR
jgi:hypothetical protein